MSKRFTALDALRGIAALMVVYFHAVQACYERAVHSTGAAYAIWDLLDWGKVGVAAFFCISGFVIPYSFRESSQHPARSFAISRLARLYPAYWCSIILVSVLWYLGGHPAKPLTTTLANLTMLQVLFGQPDLITVYWTLSVELLFYAICLAAYLSGVLRSPRFAFIGSMTCLTLTLTANALLPAAIVPLLGLSAMLLSFLWRTAIVEKRQEAVRLTPVAAVSFLLMLTFLSPRIAPTYAVRYAASWITGMLLFAIATTVHFQVPRFLVFLGTISYALYLYHQVVAAAVFKFMPGMLTAPFMAFLITAAITSVVAAASYYLVEDPCIRLGKRLG